jgi:hypothetical protein
VPGVLPFLPHSTSVTPMTLIVRNLRSDVASFVFFGLVIATTFLL